jgi:hypothetical protein
VRLSHTHPVSDKDLSSTFELGQNECRVLIAASSGRPMIANN